MFDGLWPGFDAAEVPIGSVTNGVHGATWVAREVSALADRGMGTDVGEHGPAWDRFELIADKEIWAVRRLLRERLATTPRSRLPSPRRHPVPRHPQLAWTTDVP